MTCKLNIPVLIITLCFLLTFIPVFYSVERKGLELPRCVDEPVITTPVHFFISQDVIDSHSVIDVQNQIITSIKESNRILTNSCIPMRRMLGSFRVVDFTQYTFFDINQIERILTRIVGISSIQEIHSQPNHFYSVVLGKNDNYFDNEFSGETDVDSNNRFFIIAHDADIYTIEHELGHLAWAQHEDRTWFSNLEKYLKKYASEKNQHMLKPYARGYTCSGKGTIMNRDYDVLPIYSSPDIYYQGKVCGDAKKADNATMMRSYARELREKMAKSVEILVQDH